MLQHNFRVMRAALKIMPPTLCWLMTSEVDVGDMAVETETSYQYFVIFRCLATGGGRGAD